MRRTLAAAVCMVLLAGCGGSDDTPSGLPETDSEAVGNLLEAVEEANPDNPWWDHVTREVGEGILADVTFHTDYRSGDPELKEFCEAVVDAVAKEGHFLVNFYGTKTVSEEQVDGSMESEEKDANLMNGTPDQGCTPGVFSENRNE